MGFTESPEADPWDDRSRQVERLTDRLRSMGIDRLGRPEGGSADPHGPSIADEVHRVCLVLAEAAQQRTGREQVVPPRLADAASGDQLTVIAAEYVEVMRAGAASDAQAATRAAGGRDPGELMDELLQDLRRRL